LLAAGPSYSRRSSVVGGSSDEESESSFSVKSGSRSIKRFLSR
jgi:hypothetical protein